MATRLVAVDSPGSARWAHSGSYLYSVVDPYNFDREYDIEECFGISISSPFDPEGNGYGLWADFDNQLMYLIRNGKLKLIAGVYGVAGYRDGPGHQALFGVGGFQDNAHATGMLPDRSLLVSDGRNGKIRRLVEQPNGRWNVETYTNLGSDAMAVDTQGRIWTMAGGGLQLVGGAFYGKPPEAATILQIVPLANGQLLLQSRNNSWDLTYRFDPATETWTRLCGMTESQVSAYLAQFGREPVDGPLDQAAFHTVQIAWTNRDGTIFTTGSGDEKQEREVNLITGRVTSLMNDGGRRETQIRVGAPEPNTNPNRPFWINTPGGRGADGYPYSSPFVWIPQGGLTCMKKIIAVEVPDAPGGSMQGYLDSISSGGVVSGWIVDGTAPSTVTMQIDGISAANVLANVARPDLVAAGVATEPEHGFVWSIPDQYRNGANHVLRVMYNGTALPIPSGAANFITFNLTAANPPPPTATRTVVVTLGGLTPYQAPNADQLTQYRVTLGALVQTAPLTQLTYTFVSPLGDQMPIKIEAINSDGTMTVLRMQATVTVSEEAPPPPPDPIPDPVVNLASTFSVSFS